MKKDFVKEKYKKFAEDKIESYIRNLSGMGKWISIIDRYLLKGIIGRNLYNKKDLLAI